MSIASTDCEILSLDSGVCDCPLTGEQVPVILMTIRPTDRQSPVVLAIRNPQRLVEDVPKVIERSIVLMAANSCPNTRRTRTMSREKPPVLTLVSTGSRQFPRFKIAKGDVVDSAVYWNSDDQKWYEDERKASIYEGQEEALADLHDMKMQAIKKYPCHHYMLPLYIQVYGDEPPNIQELRDWLSRAGRIVMQMPHGEEEGPDGTFGFIFVDFQDTQEDHFCT